MSAQRESLLDKIRALLSKTQANGCTEAEALAALAKARAMMDAYEVSDAELALTKEEKAVFRREPPGTRDPHRIKEFLASAIGSFAGCKVWRGSDGLVFCGMRSDAQFATWLLDHLRDFVLAEMTRHLMADLSSGADRRAVTKGFALGCATRISQRLNELVAQSRFATQGNSRALVVVKDAAISERMALDGIKLRSRRSSVSGYDGNAYAAGKSAGNRASFGRPVSGSNATLRLK